MRMARFRLKSRPAQSEKKVSGRFSEEKLRKRLLLQRGVGAATSHGPRSKSFLLLFFKKEVLSSYSVFTRLP
jgi:hypothetical protein